MAAPAPASSLADRLRAREPLAGVFAAMPATTAIETAGRLGYDLAIVDTEHGPSGPLELERHLRAAEAAGLPVLVRVPAPDPAPVQWALDGGAAGVIVPHVLDAAGAERIVELAAYPPRGRRGFATITRAGGYGRSDWAAHVERAARETVVVAMIEDAEAVPRAPDILTVHGVSAVLIGAADLALSMGHAAEPRHPEVEAAVDAVIAAAAQAGVPVLTVAGSAHDARAWRARGVQVVSYMAAMVLRAALAAGLEALRPAAPDGAGAR
jgi:4-hydroxy-2-oxoheptanedioate aldolase